jgi:hypothetical protein
MSEEVRCEKCGAKVQVAFTKKCPCCGKRSCLACIAKARIAAGRRGDKGAVSGRDRRRTS